MVCQSGLLKRELTTIVGNLETILQFVKFQEKTVRSSRLYYSKELLQGSGGCIFKIFKETATISYLRMFMGRMQMKWEMRISSRNF